MTTTHTIDVEAERVLFEARFPIMDHEILVDEDGDDYYADDATQDAWIGWLAAKRSIQPTIAAEEARFQNVWSDALEEAALICDGVNNYDNPMTAGDCADEIRALKGRAIATPTPPSKG